MEADRKVEIFWENKEPSDENYFPHVPGVTDIGNLRSKKHRKPINYKKAKMGSMSRELPLTTSESQSSEIIALKPVHLKHKNHNLQASLKDLCAEDKMRIANLIKELARTSTEKDVAIGQLTSERQQFETQVLNLLSQQEKILKERGDIQEQLLTCHKLVMTYQQQIVEQQEAVPPSDKSTRLDSSPQETDRLIASPRGNVRSNIQSAVLSPHQSPRIQPSMQASPRIVKKNSGKTVSPSEHNIPAFHQPSQDCAQSQLPIPISVLSKKSSSGPLQQPIMSSTQKSMEVLSDISRDSRLHEPTADFRRERPGPSLSDRGARFSSRYNADYASREELQEHRSRTHTTQGARQAAAWSGCDLVKLVNDELIDNRNEQIIDTDDEYVPYGSDAGLHHVGFNDRQFLESGTPEKLYSPIMDGNIEDYDIGDPDFMSYYRKLTPSERRQELLVQRQALLEEQQRLRLILSEQEDMLNLKRTQLHQQQMIQRQRLSHYERTGVFPVTAQLEMSMERDHVMLNSSQSNGTSEKYRPHTDSQSSRTCQPETKSSLLSNHVQSIGTSSSTAYADLPADVFPTRNMVDVATSITQVGSFQLHSPRQPGKVDVVNTGTDPILPTPRLNDLPYRNVSHGMSVVDMIEKIEMSQSTSHHSSSTSDQPNSSLHSSNSSHMITDTGDVQTTSTIINTTHDNIYEEEESQVLEDVFFLKI